MFSSHLFDSNKTVPNHIPKEMNLTLTNNKLLIQSGNLPLIVILSLS